MHVQSELGEQVQVEAQPRPLDEVHSSFQITPYSPTVVHSSTAESCEAASVETAVVHATATESSSNKSPVTLRTASSCPSTPASSLFTIKEGHESHRQSTLTSVDGSKPSSPTASRIIDVEANHPQDTGVRCRFRSCNAYFEGATSESSPNVKRHLRRVHNCQPKVECGFVGCSVYCTRSDNRRRHWRGKHGKALIDRSRKRKLEE